MIRDEFKTLADVHDVEAKEREVFLRKELEVLQDDLDEKDKRIKELEHQLEQSKNRGERNK